MKRILIILVFVLALGGAVGAAVYFRVGPIAKLMDPKLDAKQKLAAIQTLLPPPLPVTQNIDSVIVPIIVGHDIAREVGIDTAIVMKADAVGTVHSSLAELQDSYTMTLFQLVPKLANPFSDQSKQVIHDKLLEIAQQMYGKDEIIDIDVKNIYPR